MIEEQPGVAACAVVPMEILRAEPCAVLAMRGAADRAEPRSSRRMRGWRNSSECADGGAVAEPDLPRTSTGKVRRKAVAAWLGRSAGPQWFAFGPACEQAHLSDWLFSLIATITGEVPSGSGDAMRLAEDVHLDSLGRVQLAAAIEEKLGLPPESGWLEQVQTLGQLRRLVAAGAGASPSRAHGPVPATSPAVDVSSLGRAWWRRCIGDFRSRCSAAVAMEPGALDDSRPRGRRARSPALFYPPGPGASRSDGYASRSSN